MATTPSIQLSIAAGGAPGDVLVTVYGDLGVADVARLEAVLDDLLNDEDLVAIALDLHHVEGDISGISGLAAAAERAGRQGADLTLCRPNEALGQALESAGLAGRIRLLQRDRRPPWSVVAADRRARNHPSGQFPVGGATVGGSAHHA